jgi:hypothetical protein
MWTILHNAIVRIHLIFVQILRSGITEEPTNNEMSADIAPPIIKKGTKAQPKEGDGPPLPNEYQVAAIKESLTILQNILEGMDMEDMDDTDVTENMNGVIDCFGSFGYDIPVMQEENENVRVTFGRVLASGEKALPDLPAPKSGPVDLTKANPNSGLHNLKQCLADLPMLVLFGKRNLIKIIDGYLISLDSVNLGDSQEDIMREARMCLMASKHTQKIHITEEKADEIARRRTPDASSMLEITSLQDLEEMWICLSEVVLGMYLHFPFYL